MKGVGMGVGNMEPACKGIILYLWENFVR